MRVRAVLALAGDNLRRNPFFFLAAAFGAAAAVAVLVFFAGLGYGLKFQVGERLFSTLPETRLKIGESGLDLGLLSFAKPSFLKGARLDEKFLSEIRQRPETTDVYGEMNIAFPIRIRGTFFGQSVVTDLIATGLDPAVVAAELSNPTVFGERESPPVPVLISRQLLDLYNTAFAPMNHFPALKEETIIGFRFDLELGRSYLGGRAEHGQIRLVQCEVVGFSNKAVTIGITLPLGYVRRWNAEFTGEPQVYSALYVDAKNAADIDSLKLWVESKGFTVQTAREGTPARVRQALAFVMGLLFSIAGVVMALAAANTAFLLYIMVRRRRPEIALWRSLGATRLEMAVLVLAEAAGVALTGWILGGLAGYGGAVVFENLVLGQAGELAVLIGQLFVFPIWLAPASLAFCFFFVTLGALAPAISAAYVDPAGAMRRQ
ncbi:MAG: ABC transporter permease [Myxococcales bacterium]|nr:MAG: ABC transporter permease [Myxococcales bacterium]